MIQRVDCKGPVAIVGKEGAWVEIMKEGHLKLVGLDKRGTIASVSQSHHHHHHYNHYLKLVLHSL